MTHPVSENLLLRIRAVGSQLPEDVANDWGTAINHDLHRLDAAIGQVCTSEQIAEIRRLMAPLRMF